MIVHTVSFIFFYSFLYYNQNLGCKTREHAFKYMKRRNQRRRENRAFFSHEALGTNMPRLSKCRPPRTPAPVVSDGSEAPVTGGRAPREPVCRELGAGWEGGRTGYKNEPTATEWIPLGANGSTAPGPCTPALAPSTAGWNWPAPLKHWPPADVHPLTSLHYKDHGQQLINMYNNYTFWLVYDTIWNWCVQ